MTITTDMLLGLLALLVTLLIGIAVGIAFEAARTRRARASAPGTGEAAAAPEAPAGPDPQDQSAPARAAGGMRRAAIVLNPVKAHADFRASAAAVCREAGWAEPLIIETEEEDPGTEMAREALAAGVDVVVAAGGDGTVRPVAEQLVHTGVPLGIVPLGTGNLLARNLSIVLGRPEWALRTALWGVDTSMDVAHAQLSPEGEDHVFLVMAGLGFDAAVMADTNDALKTRVGWLAYVEAGSRKLLGNRAKVSLRFDDKEPKETRVRSVLGGNCGKVQGGLELLPGAKVDDGILDVLIVSPKNLADWFGVIASVVGRRRRGLHTEITPCSRVVIEAEDEMEVQLDGDPCGETAYLAMEIDPGSLVVRTAGEELRRRIRAADWPVPFGYTND